MLQSTTQHSSHGLKYYKMHTTQEAVVTVHDSLYTSKLISHPIHDFTAATHSKKLGFVCENVRNPRFPVNVN